MTYLALRHRGRVAETAPATLPRHDYAPERGLNVVPDGRPLVQAVRSAELGMFAMTLTHHPRPIGSKKDDE